MIVDILRSAEVELELHNSESVGDLESKVAAAVDNGAQRIVVAGGDGSIHEAVNGILSSDRGAALGVVPTGTGNDFAKACDIPLDWQLATQLLADRLTSSPASRSVDVGRCNDRYFANGAGIGFDAKVTRVARSIRLPIGDLVYLLAIFRTMFDGIATPEVTMTADGFEWRGAVTLANISNGPWVGGMFQIAPPAKNADGWFDLVIAKPVTRRRVLSLLPKLMNGEHLNEVEIEHERIQSLTIEANEAIPSHLDGEVQPLQSRFEIELLPGALRLL